MNKYGNTALHAASYHGRVNVMKHLLHHGGADVNQQNGWTALHWATMKGKLDAVMLLLENGADPYIQNEYNNTALDLAHQYKQTNVANAIQQHIQRPQQIRELIQSNDKLPIALWANALGRLESINFIFSLVCEIPHIFQQTAAEKEEEMSRQHEQANIFSTASSQRKKEVNFDGKN